MVAIYRTLGIIPLSVPLMGSKMIQGPTDQKDDATHTMIDSRRWLVSLVLIDLEWILMSN